MKTTYYQDQSTVKDYIKMAEGHDGKIIIDDYCNYISPEANLLEIGSGPGTDWKILSQNFNTVGSDNSLAFIEHLKTNYPSEVFLTLDAVTLHTKEIFNGIYSNKVLHHLTDNDLKHSIKRQHELLEADGTICHSFWNGTGDEFFKEMFVNYHMEEELTNLFSPFFDIIKIQLYKEFESDDSIYLIARKK